MCVEHRKGGRRGAPPREAGPLPLTSISSVAERSILYTELLASLHFFATSHPALVGQLCQQVQSWFRMCPHPVLVPLRGFLQPPGGPLQATLTGCHKGASPKRSQNPARPLPAWGQWTVGVLGCSLGLPSASWEAPRVPSGPGPAVSC